MVESKLIIDKLTILYDGLFEVKEFYKVVDRWFKDNSYDRKEKLSSELVREGSKEIELVLQPWKNISDYAKFRFDIRIIMKGVKEVEIEKDGIKLKMQKAKVEVYIDAFLDTDIEHRWETKPLFFFLRTLVDKYVYKFYSDRYETLIKADVANLHSTMKSYLNLNRFG
jgi:hypothetical protein